MNGRGIRMTSAVRTETVVLDINGSSERRRSRRLLLQAEPKPFLGTGPA